MQTVTPAIFVLLSAVGRELHLNNVLESDLDLQIALLIQDLSECDFHFSMK